MDIYMKFGFIMEKVERKFINFNSVIPFGER